MLKSSSSNNNINIAGMIERIEETRGSQNSQFGNGSSATFTVLNANQNNATTNAVLPAASAPGAVGK